MAKKIVLKNHNTMTIMVTFFGQHYFHNVNLRFASIHIMKIMLTKKSDIIVHNVVKGSAFPDGKYFGQNYFHNDDRNIAKIGKTLHFQDIMLIRS